MIWERIISVISGVFIALISLFPYADSEVLDQINGSLSPFKAYLNNANWLFPVSDFFIIIGIVLTIESGILVIKIVHWILKNLSVGFVK